MREKCASVFHFFKLFFPFHIKMLGVFFLLLDEFFFKLFVFLNRYLLIDYLLITFIFFCIKYNFNPFSLCVTFL